MRYKNKNKKTMKYNYLISAVVDKTGALTGFVHASTQQGLEKKAEKHGMKLHAKVIYHKLKSGG